MSEGCKQRNSIDCFKTSPVRSFRISFGGVRALSWIGKGSGSENNRKADLGSFLTEGRTRRFLPPRKKSKKALTFRAVVRTYHILTMVPGRGVIRVGAEAVRSP
jgi:hypothetical protein